MQCSRAWEGERDAPNSEAARQVPEHERAGRGAFCAKSLAAETKIRTVSSCLAPYGASPKAAEIVSFLTSDRYA
jgi:hypothetical protein